MAISYLLDTNHASKLLDGNAFLTQRVASLHKQGVEFGISITVLGELYYAAYASQRREINLRRIVYLLERVPVWPYDQIAAEEFGRILAEQKATGCPIPPIDAQIAAVARVRGLTVLTADHHFKLVGGLRVENWLDL
ncbi:MAG: type II toxin-antitoxin system VapC family toxin [Anaerolineae bacterium]|jgi:tRNA(fMet)-specific endonuclease VapC|nr:type II toxin-antitoxin system VapC family toxin [Anaerolineae bacterium]MDH7474029.1 type II toxin-antitoxin system VapC family toxin [Anaerolineae bacterium]